jgi:F0F1-type ATP synthase assembly protein I
MTGPDNGSNGTRPISVAELLAKNGTIGAPPAGGRRRRRRGNSDAVTVAELTGEIPIIRTGGFPAVKESGPEDKPEEKAADEPAEAEPETSAPERRVPPQRAEDPLPRRGRPETLHRSADPRPLRRSELPPEPVKAESDKAGAAAELMNPDPATEAGGDDIDLAPDELGIGEPALLVADDTTLFGGDSMADDLARGRAQVLAPEDDLGLLEDLDSADEEDVEADAREDAETDETAETPLTRKQLVKHGLWVALQSIVAVVFGAGLFLAFDQLWRWYSFVALVLGVLVILGLVVGVRIVRKTEDIGSTLTAVAVGALVTFGPLALLQAN